MCGRYSLVVDFAVLEGRFNIKGGLQLPLAPRYNIAPTQEVLAVTSDGSENHAELMKWGLIPSWAKDPSIGNRMINAKAETLAERPSFNDAFRKRRCLIPADGFYEWMSQGKGRVPMRITLKTGEPFAFAGLWEVWHDPSTGLRVKSCAIITTSANELMQPIHSRMPALLRRSDETAWTDPSRQDILALQGLLRPYAASEMDAYEVASLVNSPKNETVECIARVS